jgi:hypothetical protein
MYHLEVNCGESPDWAMVKPTPEDEYVGVPWEVKLSEDPDVKSILTVLPRAESAGHPDW